MSWRDRLFPVEEVTENKIREYIEILEKENVPGLDVVIDSIVTISNSGVYDESRRAYDSIKSKFYWWEKSIHNEIPENSVYFLAHENLDYINFIPQKSARIINFFTFMCMYDFIAIRYFMTIKRDFDDLDVLNVYLSGLDERLIFGLDNFDKISDWPQPTVEFFKKLKEISWENKDIKTFSNRLGLLKVNMTVTSFGLPKYAHFSTIEKKLIELIAGCNAVNDNRDCINKEDIVIGYKTYLKLLNTDVTKYKARSNFKVINKKDDGGYLVCDKCNQYYKLRPGESPEDFTDECECGGKLKYYDNIDWLYNTLS
ncbi:MAG: hypothetical protein HVN34_07580 [Methanobacteriaceae archaeon]|jgi:hypothetical protein|nr:hypothetical protein [Methanobacteriaceae archaeon]